MDLICTPGPLHCHFSQQKYEQLYVYLIYKSCFHKEPMLFPFIENKLLLTFLLPYADSITHMQ